MYEGQSKMAETSRQTKQIEILLRELYDACSTAGDNTQRLSQIKRGLVMDYPKPIMDDGGLRDGKPEQRYPDGHLLQLSEAISQLNRANRENKDILTELEQYI